jgi:hypothetical protein
MSLSSSPLLRPSSLRPRKDQRLRPSRVMLGHLYFLSVLTSPLSVVSLILIPSGVPRSSDPSNRLLSLVLQLHKVSSSGPNLPIPIPTYNPNSFGMFPFIGIGEIQCRVVVEESETSARGRGAV